MSRWQRLRELPWREKLKAFTAHLVISAVVFTLIIAITVWLLYPPPFFWIDGGLQITLLAASIDIIAGPLLTLVVYRPNKPRLVMNLAVIAAIQFGALAWGVRVLYQERPVLMAFVGYNQNRFFPITELQVSEGPRSLDELRALSDQRPPMVYIELPEEARDARRVLTGSPTSVLRQTERFRKIEGERLQYMVRASRTPKQYEIIAPEMAEALKRFAAGNGKKLEDYAFIPLYGRFGSAMLAISPADGHIVGVVTREMRLR